MIHLKLNKHPIHWHAHKTEIFGSVRYLSPIRTPIAGKYRYVTSVGSIPLSATTRSFCKGKYGIWIWDYCLCEHKCRFHWSNYQEYDRIHWCYIIDHGSLDTTVINDLSVIAWFTAMGGAELGLLEWWTCRAYNSNSNGLENITAAIRRER